jgi:methylmalonyl-CoA mutase N-terminal domain/subunit
MEDLYAGIDLERHHHVDDDQLAGRRHPRHVRRQAEKAGVNRSQLGGTLQNDILKEYQAQKEFVFPPRPSMRLVRDTIAFTAAEMPRWHSISISGYHIREAGSTAVEELAFTLANGFAYVELALQAGLPVDAFAPRLSFFFNAHIDFFEEIAKYRAARRIWARWMRERYGAQLERSQQLRFHTQTAGVSLTAQQPEVNIVRTAIEALAGVLGGDAVPAHQLDGRGDGAAHGEGGSHRTAHPAGAGLRDQRRPRRRSSRRVLVRRVPDRRGRAPGRGAASPTSTTSATARCWKA